MFDYHFHKLSLIESKVLSDSIPNALKRTNNGIFHSLPSPLVNIKILTVKTCSSLVIVSSFTLDFSLCLTRDT